MKNQRYMFSIHLIEDSDGQVRVVSDWSGDGDRCLELGIEIMQHLNAIQPYTDNQLQIVIPTDTKLSH